MNPKQAVITLVILNIILLGFFYVLTQTTILKNWFSGENTSKICPEQTTDGETIFVFCGEAEAE